MSTTNTVNTVTKQKRDKPPKPSEIDISKVLYEKLKVIKPKDGGQETKQVKISYNRSKFIFSTPKMRVKYGHSQDLESKKKEGATKKFTLDCDIDLENPEHKQLKEMIEKLDNKNIDHCVERSEEWFKQKKSKAGFMDGLYGSGIKQKEGEMKFRLKLPFSNGVPTFSVYDQFNKEINWYDKRVSSPELNWNAWSQKEMYVESICECDCLWVVNTNVYCSFKVIQLRVTPPATIRGCGFDEPTECDDDLKVDEDYEKVEKSEVEKPEVKKQEATVEPEQVDEELEDGVEVEYVDED